MVSGDQMQDFAGVYARREQQKPDGDRHAGPKDETLEDVGPDDRLKSADQRVEDGDDAENYDDSRKTPAGDSAD